MAGGARSARAQRPGGQAGQRRAKSGARPWARADGCGRQAGLDYRAARRDRPVSTQEARTSQAMSWLVPPRPHWPSGRNAGRHESPEVKGRGDNDQALTLDQVAASQISVATRIATNTTTTMTAAGIARSLRSCLCTSVLLALDGAEHGAADEPGAAAPAPYAAPAALAVAEPTLVRSGVAPPALRAEVPAPTGPAARTARRGRPDPG